MILRALYIFVYYYMYWSKNNFPEGEHGRIGEVGYTDIADQGLTGEQVIK